MTSGRPFSADTYVISGPIYPSPRGELVLGRTLTAVGQPSPLPQPPPTRLDLGSISPVLANTLGRAFSVMEPWSRYPFTPEALATYFAACEPHAPRFVIQVDGEIAGAVGIRAELLRGPYLQFLGLLPGFQGRGIGAAILDWMEAEAGPSTRNLWVCASVSNEAAIRFYERHGFRRIAVLDGLVQDGFDEVMLRKRLK